MGGYPNFTPLYESYGYEVLAESKMRKVLKLLKKQTPAVVVAEFNYQSDFRDRTSSLESLLSVIQRHPEVKVIITVTEFIKGHGAIAFLSLALKFAHQWEKKSSALSHIAPVISPIAFRVLYRKK